MQSMHRAFAAILMIMMLPFTLPAIAPSSGDIGEIAVYAEPGSITDVTLDAVREEYTEEWLEKYTASPYIFGEAYSPVLSDLLPLSNPVAGKESGGAVDILDLATGSITSFIFQDGKIQAVYPVRGISAP